MIRTRLCCKHLQVLFGLMNYMTFDAELILEKIGDPMELNFHYQEGNPCYE